MDRPPYVMFKIKPRLPADKNFDGARVAHRETYIEAPYLCIF
jgi:hypothetical protein